MKLQIALFMILSVAATSFADPTEAPSTLTGTIHISGNSVSDAVAGTYVRNGKTLTSKDSQVEESKQHAKVYDGPTTFDMIYSIELNADHTLKSGTVRLETKTWTAGGKTQTSSFKTTDLDVSKIGLTDGALTSLEFQASGDPGWYPKSAPGSGGIANRDLTGKVDLATKKYSSVAHYSSKTSGAVYTYTVEGSAELGSSETPPASESGKSLSNRENGIPHARREADRSALERSLERSLETHSPSDD